MSGTRLAHAPAAPAFTPVYGGLLQRKCACGGSPGLDGECAECRKRRLAGRSRPAVQPKLKIGRPGDRYEQEADRAAEQALRMPAPGRAPPRIQPAFSPGGLRLQRQPTEDIIDLEEEEDRIVQTKEAGGPSPEITAPAAAQIQQGFGPGQTLPDPVRTSLEGQFGADFSRVRIHTGREADRATRSVNALAFTVGRDVVFREGRFDPESPSGRRLLAHELVHTIQQGAAVQQPAVAPVQARAAGLEGDRRPATAPQGISTAPLMLQRLACNFFVYDSTESGAMGTAWSAGAWAREKGSWGGYAVASGGNIEMMLTRVLDEYADEDCDCTEEIQFWSHGSSGNAMYISKSGDELTAADFNIPDVEKYGGMFRFNPEEVKKKEVVEESKACSRYSDMLDRCQDEIECVNAEMAYMRCTQVYRQQNPSRLADFEKWFQSLTKRQQLLVRLRATICGPDAEVYYRSCEAFQGKTGQEFAKASARFWRSKVIGHTKIIGLTQPGQKTLRPGEEPSWSELEGTGATRFKKRSIKAETKPKKD